jgi:hypothetical protein
MGTRAAIHTDGSQSAGAVPAGRGTAKLAKKLAG